MSALSNKQPLPTLFMLFFVIIFLPFQAKGNSPNIGTRSCITSDDVGTQW